LRFIVFQDREGWLCAQCVDFDLSAQVRSLKLLPAAIDRLIRGHIAVRERHHLEAFKDLPPAPERFLEMFDRSKMELPTRIIAFKASGTLPRPEVRIAAAAVA
jgi:hypothetical protein